MAFRKAGLSVKLDVETDGHNAMATLSNPSTGLPACILLDIKLPTISGLELLSWIRKQPHLRRVPVIMFTSSLLPGDINKAYDLGANSYLIKPSKLDSLIELVRMVDLYWIRTNTPPSNGA